MRDMTNSRYHFIANKGRGPTLHNSGFGIYENVDFEFESDQPVACTLPIQFSEHDTIGRPPPTALEELKRIEETGANVPKNHQNNEHVIQFPGSTTYHTLKLQSMYQKHCFCSSEDGMTNCRQDLLTNFMFIHF